jgi:Ca2+-transporting ATPase
VVAGLYVMALRRDEPASDARALAFVALVIGNLVLVLVNRSFDSSLILAFRRPNPVLWWVAALAALLLTLAVTWPPAQTLFRFGPIHPDDVGLCLLGGLLILAALESLKPIWRISLRV